jgi:hypothetical protein
MGVAITSKKYFHMISWRMVGIGPITLFSMLIILPLTYLSTTGRLCSAYGER